MEAASGSPLTSHTSTFSGQPREKKEGFIPLESNLIIRKNCLDKRVHIMACKYDLHHWDNSSFKNFVIIMLCEMKNDVFLVIENKNPVATFQVRVDEVDDLNLHFEKLACSPRSSGKGIGSYCMNYMEEMARNKKCKKVCLEVYSSSKHAIEFYKHRGYVVSGEIKTLKYNELKMEKLL